MTSLVPRRTAGRTRTHTHLARTIDALQHFTSEVPRLEHWGQRLAHTLLGGGRLLVAGNGGSAAHAQHLASELVGRYRNDRAPLSAIALHAETSSLSAIVNDYGVEEMFARQVRAHGRAGDVLLSVSTSGRSPNVLAAVDSARAAGLESWALTGGAPNPLVQRCDDSVIVAARATAVIQEVHQVAIHILCEAIDDGVRRASVPAGDAGRDR